MPAIGKDLSKIRSHLGLSIQDIQHYTKIPVSTLKSIENGKIFNHPDENQTYVRSFVRSYARALKIDDDVMIKALDQNEAGTYSHLLLEDYPELYQDKATEHEPETPTESKPELENENSEPEPDEYSEPSEPQLFDQQEPEYDEGEPEPEPLDDAPETEIKHIKIEDEPADEIPEEKPAIASTSSSGEGSKLQTTETERSVKSVDWADVGRKFNQEKKHTPIWLVGLIIIVIVAIFVGYFLYQNGFLSVQNVTPEEQQEQITPASETSQSNLSLDLEDSLSASETADEYMEGTPSASEPDVQLGDVIELTVYAAYDDLGPVRVWSDLKPRMDPYWLEQGTAMQFEFEDTIRVRGSYTDLLLLKDGHLVENAAQGFLQQEGDYIQLTREFFSSDPKWATSIDYELPEGVTPPDSIATRPTF